MKGHLALLLFMYGAQLSSSFLYFSSSVTVSPSTGVALTNVFKISMPSWVTDSDGYPLSYTYSYVIG